MMPGVDAHRHDRRKLADRRNGCADGPAACEKHGGRAFGHDAALDRTGAAAGRVVSTGPVRRAGPFDFNERSFHA